jgi:sulfhydrogenase subunit beta (sulfur reductase)
MTQGQFQKFINFLQNKHRVYAPKKEKGDVVIKEIEDVKNFKLISELPLHGWKRFLLPPCHTLFDFKKEKLEYCSPKIESQVLLGVSTLDLRAMALYNQAWEKDPWYQEIKKKTIVIGHNLAPKDKYIFWIEKFEEDQLEHLPFDIFIVVKADEKDKYKIFTGSEDGQRLLDKFGYKNYEHVDYMGPNREEGFDKKMAAIHEAMKSRHNQKIWDDLAKRCIECGKCAIACPTCYCFDIFDTPSKKKEEGERRRCSSSCFYQEFFEVAGAGPQASKHKFLKTTAERIFFWYEHHFVRMTDDYGVVGCVACGRCSKVCPVSINIFEEIQKILK